MRGHYYSRIVKFLQDNRQYLEHNNFDGLYEAYMKDDSLDFYFGPVVDFFLSELKINVLDYLSKLESSTFMGSESQELDLSKNTKITEIPNRCFKYLRDLVLVKLPPNITSIGSYAFDECTRLTSIDIPPSVTNIGYHAFYYCGRLASITIPESVTSIGEQAFYNCSPDLVIYTPAGSYAQNYANKNNIWVVTT